MTNTTETYTPQEGDHVRVGKGKVTYRITYVGDGLVLAKDTEGRSFNARELDASRLVLIESGADRAAREEAARDAEVEASIAEHEASLPADDGGPQPEAPERELTLVVGTEVRLNSTAPVGEGMRAVVVPPRHRIERGRYVLVVIGMPLGLMEFDRAEFDVIEDGAAPPERSIASTPLSPDVIAAREADTVAREVRTRARAGVNIAGEVGL